MGRVAGSYGVRGWVKVAPDTGAGAGLTAVGEWWIGADAFEVSEARVHGATVVGRLTGIETREQAGALKGRTVAVRREALPEPEEGKYYLADLVGLEVVSLEGAVLGVVRGTFSNGAHDVIEVAGERMRLIPWVAAVVKEVDLAGRRVRVDWQTDW
ncbi:MAG TPA: ribosome maturation factor RimM [Burkholderiales bacterium]|jgi:16S rRNA processing protein RimM